MEVTELIVGTVVSITSALLFPRDPEAAGLAKVRVAFSSPAFFIVPEFSASELVAL